MRDGPNQRSFSFSMVQARLAQAFSESSSQKQLFSCLVITVCALVLLVHLPALSSQALMYDDQLYVTENPLVQKPSWESARRFFGEVWMPSTVPGYYHPLAMISLMVDRFLGGPYENMRTYHRTSLALHVANTALLAVFLYLLFPQPFVAAAVALLFGLHPITVDSVCWMSERKTVLSSFFALWSLIAYVKFARERKIRFYVGCIVTYALAMLSKPIALPLPFMMLLLDCWPLDRLRWRRVTEKLPLFALAGAFGVIGYISQVRTASIRLPGQYNPLQVPLVLSHNIVFYTCKLLRPTNLSPHYEPPEYLTLFSAPMIGSIIGACILILLLVLSLRWTRGILISCLIAFVMLFPAGGIISHTIVMVANRYLYLPIVGLLLLVAWLLRELSAAGARYNSSWPHVGGVTVVLLLASMEGLATRQYLHCWSDTETLYEYMLSMFPTSTTLHNDLGAVLNSQGRRKEATEHFRCAARLTPTSFQAHYNLALTLDESGGPTKEVIRHYRRALGVDPRSVRTHINMGVVQFRAGNCSDGLADLRKATEIAPKSILAQYNLGRMLVISDQPQEGLSYLRRAIEIDPRFLPAWKDLAWFLATHPDSQVRDPNAAVKAAEQARKMTRDGDARVLDMLAAAYASGGQYRKAVETARKALAVATRLGASELAGQIEERIRLYENECPYYENPRVQLDRMITESKKKEAGNSNPQSRLPRGARNDMIQNPKSGDRELEVQDGAEAIVAE